jgi:hypothetical protein
MSIAEQLWEGRRLSARGIGVTSRSSLLNEWGGGCDRRRGIPRRSADFLAGGRRHQLQSLAGVAPDFPAKPCEFHDIQPAFSLWIGP